MMSVEVEVAELPTEVHDKIKVLCAEGDDLARRQDYKLAIQTYNKAWGLVPEPRTDWNASTWILGAIADAAYLGGFLQTARDALDHVMLCPRAIGNPFLHLRLGEVLFEADELTRSANELTRAYALAGKEIFENEDPKYLSFLGTKIDLSASSVA